MPTALLRSPPGRIAAIDLMRGGALAGMAAYHLLWDLHAFGMSALDPAARPAIRWFGDAVAACFLVLSGLSLHLAAAAGHSRRRVLGRLGVLALAAGGVTLATTVLVPEAAVQFGILHCIVVTNLVALLLRRLPGGVLALLAATALGLPFVWPWRPGVAWAWIGLSPVAPVSLDFRPVLPWVAFTLLGLVAGRTALVPWLARLPSRGVLARATAAAGRHSLPIYLIHQPVLVCAVWIVALALGLAGYNAAQPLSPTEAAGFLAACAESCAKTGTDPVLCRSTCHCVLTRTLAPAASDSLRARLHPVQVRLQHAVTACRRSLS